MITSFLRAQRTRIIWVGILLVLLLLGLNAWYRAIYADPRRVFAAMLDNSLRTGSVSKQIVQGDEAQSLNQRVRVQTGEQHVAQSITELSQSGLANAQVVTESIGTPTADFVRYASIQTDQKSAGGNELDFSKVIGVWGKAGATGSTSGELYNESVLGVIPIGNLPADKRHKLVALAQELDVYKVEYANVVRGTKDGRPTYEYTVKVLPAAYVTLLKVYAEMSGLTHLKNINPQSYESADPIEFKVVVDVMTRRLATINYANGRTENYVSYGSKPQVALPNDPVTIEELQLRLQDIE